MRGACLISLLLLSFLPAAARSEQFDVLVYGATPAGIAAACAAAGGGDKVLLVEPTDRIGGMMTNGLSHADFRSFEGLTGAFLNFSRRVESYYEKTYGKDSEQVKACFRGTQAEPKVNLAIFEEMLAAHPKLRVEKTWMLEAVRCSSEAIGDGAGPKRSVEIGLFVDGKGERHSIAARFFIDATYEGDLMAAAGVPYRVGREGRDEFTETLAPESPDSELQAYNFRLCMTRDPANRAAVEAPAEYDREEFTGILPMLGNGKITGVFGMEKSQIIKAHTPSLPNGKYDINDMSRGYLRLSLPGANAAWPDGTGGVALRAGASPTLQAPPFSRVALLTARARVFVEHLKWHVGLIYFLQNDAAVPERFRAEAREWGWCKDEFTEYGHLPGQLYVREARRMRGKYLFREQDTDLAPGDARAVLQRDAIAMGDYGLNCHGTGREGDRTIGRHTGEFYRGVSPYQIPYGVLLPEDVDNLLVPGAMSASHVGFCALRLEPIWMSLGEAAGHAAHLARARNVTTHQVSVPELQRRLHQVGAATVYMSDVLPGHPDFDVVQWWGTAGGFHGLAAASGDKAMRGRKIVGQYHEAFPAHAAELQKPLDAELRKRWTNLAEELGIEPEKLPEESPDQTRGAWLRAVWEIREAAEPKTESR